MARATLAVSAGDVAVREEFAVVWAGMLAEYPGVCVDKKRA